MGWQDKVIEPVGLKARVKVGVIVGRFQTDRLTQGHWNLITSARKEVDHLIVLIGWKDELDADNPLPLPARREVLHQALISGMVDRVGYIKDNPGHNSAWLTAVMQHVYDFRNSRGLSNEGIDITFWGGDDSSFLDVAASEVPLSRDLIKRIPRKAAHVSASQRRRDIRQLPDWEDAGFRRGVIWATREKA